MDDRTAFMDLAALLTGVHRIVTDPEDKGRFEPIADEYRRRLSAVLRDPLQKLLDAYKVLAGGDPKPPLNDSLLGKLRATQEFKDNEFAAKQIVNIWCFSQFKPEDKDVPFLDGGFYEEGLAWRLIKAHPVGFSDQPNNYWTHRP